jgi:hypothetical protein
MSPRLLAVLVAALASGSLAACGGKKAGPTTPATPDGPVGTLRSLENGDRACYVVVETDAGEQSIEGDFGLCPGGDHDATGLIGQRVTWTTTKANVLAAACEGDADCGQSDEVGLVTTITAAP